MTAQAPEPTVAELKAQLAEMTRQRDLYAGAISDALTKTGTYNSHGSFSGAQLLQFVDELADDYLRGQAAIAVATGKPVLLRRVEVEEALTEPLPNEPVYALSVEYAGHGVIARMAPANTSDEGMDDLPCLTMLLQVDGGVPSVFLHGGEGNRLLKRFHALPNGVIAMGDGDVNVPLEEMGLHRPDPKKMADEIAAIASRNGKAIADAAAHSTPKG